MANAGGCASYLRGGFPFHPNLTCGTRLFGTASQTGPQTWFIATYNSAALLRSALINSNESEEIRLINSSIIARLQTISADLQ